MGRISAVAEKWNPHVGPHGIRQDLFGFIDVITLDPERGIVAIQTCAGSGYQKHLQKILTECSETALEWIRCGGYIELWAWRKIKAFRGAKREVWDPRVKTITLEDFKK